MGGGGGLLGGVTNALFGSPDTPATPDYSGAAQQTAQGNLDAARQATAANRVNQVTPYGSLSYAVTGEDPYGNPTWTATTRLNPDQQQLYNYDVQSALGLGRLQTKGLDYVGNMISQPFNTSNLTGLRGNIDPSRTGMAGWDRATNLVMQRLQPQLEQQQKSFDAQMANQGIPLGSEAYANAKRLFDQRQNDQLTSASLGGASLQNQLFGQEVSAANLANQARGQGFQELAYQRNEPINTLNAVRSGSQVTNPNSFFVNAPQQATTAGADMLGAAGMTGNANIAAANANNAQRNAMIQGLFSIGAAKAGS
jgi:hypothetical protein